jgi:hypothetical protein
VFREAVAGIMFEGALRGGSVRGMRTVRA